MRISDWSSNVCASDLRNIGDIIAHVASKEGVVIDIGDDKPAHMVGHNLRAYIQDLEKQMRDAAADLEFEEAGRLRDEIRKLEADELGLPADQQVAPRVGRSNEGKQNGRASGRERVVKQGEIAGVAG